LVGEDPLWAGFYARYDPDQHRFVARDAPRTRYGFRVKVLWIMSPDHDESVTVAGRNLETDARVHFHFEGLRPTSVATLSQDVAGVSETEWREFPSYVYFDRAGCFTLNMRSEAASWKLGFGFGG
jgi:hypothetical protein